MNQKRTKPSIKRILATFLIGGIVYALGMAGFDYKDGEPFDLNKFILQAILFGAIIVVADYFEYWRKKKS